MPELHTFTGGTTRPLWSFRLDTPNNPIVPADEERWLRENPRQVARIRRLEVLMHAELNHSEPMFVFSIRLLDPRKAEGWRLATVALPGTAPYNYEDETTLDEVWRSMQGGAEKENDFVLSALNEAVCTGEMWAEPILNLIVLPDPSFLDPDGWGLDFTPYDPKP